MEWDFYTIYPQPNSSLSGSLSEAAGSGERLFSSS